MSTIGKRVIYVGPVDKGMNCRPQTAEGIALQAIKPGTVVEHKATGIDISTAAATVFGTKFLVADKDQLRSRSVDDDWTSGDTMQAIAPRSGEFINVLVAAGNNITERGTGLSRNGAGLLKIAAVGGTEEIVAYAEEIINVTADALVCVSPA